MDCQSSILAWQTQTSTERFLSYVHILIDHLKQSNSSLTSGQIPIEALRSDLVPLGRRRRSGAVMRYAISLGANLNPVWPPCKKYGTAVWPRTLLGQAVYRTICSADIRCLLEHGARVDESAVHICCKRQARKPKSRWSQYKPLSANHRYEIIKALLDHGADPNAKEVGLQYNTRWAGAKTRTSRTPLQIAKKFQDGRIIELLVEWRAFDVDDGK